MIAGLTHLDFSALSAGYAYFAVFAIVGLESLGVPLPGETTLIAASIYAGATHNLSIGVVIAAASAGAVIGDNIGYLIGHWGGYRLLIRYGRYVRLDESKVKVAHYLFARHGGKVVFFGRFVAILRTYAAFLAGTARMPWRRFLVFNAMGGLVWATVYGIAADSFGKEIDKLSHPFAIAFGVAGVIAMIATVIFIRRHERRLEAIAQQAYPGPLAGYPGGPSL